MSCDTLASTNDAAADLAPGGAVLARTQTAGRGQHGRTWHSPPGAGLWLSARLDPAPPLRRPAVLTALVAVAVADAVAALCGVAPVLKWPNDLLLGGRKVCGILIEQRTTCVAGVGLNLRQSHAELLAAGLPGATSLAEWGAAVGPEAAAEAVLGRLAARLAEAADALAPLEAAWRDRLGLLNQPVVADLLDGTRVAGRLAAVGFDRLVVGETAVAPEAVRHLRPT